MKKTSYLLKITPKIYKMETEFVNNYEDIDLFDSRVIYDQICSDYDCNYQELIDYGKEIGWLDSFNNMYSGFISDVLGEIVLYDKTSDSKTITINQRKKMLDELFSLFKKKREEIDNKKEEKTKNSLFVASMINAMKYLEEHYKWDLSLGEQIDIIEHSYELQEKENYKHLKGILIQALNQTYSVNNSKIKKSELKVFTDHLDEYYHLADI